MTVRIQHRLPEFSLALLGAFFFLRELGTFPAAWSDDSLFMIVAKEIAAGRGYALPILDHAWPYPHVLLIGPTLLYPVAASIKLFGFSIAVARIPMVLYLMGTAVAFYHLTLECADRKAARWATLLLITLSAFVNTGKPVMGEIPAFFFALLGLLWMLRADTAHRAAVLTGIAFGLAVLTKLSFALIYPAIAIAWIVALCTGKKSNLRALTIIGLIAAIIPLPWKLLEFSSHGGLGSNIAFIMGNGDGGGLEILQGNLGLLLRLPYLTYGLMLVLGSIGLWVKRRTLPQSLWWIVVSLIALFTLYFLSSFGWYRHVLPAHLLLIPFVVIGLRSLVHPHMATVLLALMALAQGLWQLDHQGASKNPASIEAAAYIESHLQRTELIIQQAEIFVQVPHRPQWRFLTNPILSERVPQQFVTLTEKQQCMHILRGITEQERDQYTQENRLVVTIGKYAVIRPPANCS